MVTSIMGVCLSISMVTSIMGICLSISMVTSIMGVYMSVHFYGYIYNGCIYVCPFQWLHL